MLSIYEISQTYKSKNCCLLELCNSHGRFLIELKISMLVIVSKNEPMTRTVSYFGLNEVCIRS